MLTSVKTNHSCKKKTKQTKTELGQDKENLLSLYLLIVKLHYELIDQSQL